MRFKIRQIKANTLEKRKKGGKRETQRISLLLFFQLAWKLVKLAQKGNFEIWMSDRQVLDKIMLRKIIQTVILFHGKKKVFVPQVSSDFAKSLVGLTFQKWCKTEIPK